jgi:hypothetical protein
MADINSGDSGKTSRRLNPIPVTCRLSDCYFFAGFTDPEVGRALCSHPEKELYRTNSSCPLYRFDWQHLVKKQKAASGPKKPR